ncbi:anti-sigma factor [Photobacterium sp. WH77]|uniref:anti-sigma factor n=1 Tax=unclassified Photobacterium TaxID=2628852 RepID=UPI001C474961|nr:MULTISPECIES: anti-sigma factor [unclassified Photobacterium]MBV7263638.1 anti-sigma factor [Photobacterium sp. WH24]MCG2836487.1 anti-sigma factor [Photobacterium sp. WH77]MCG2843886.1 anti-sigma factor [Photobacterium sp. WH80]
MNYNNQTLIDMLAAEYVLGTLRGPARQRFQTLIMQSTHIREATWQWEQHLNEINRQITPVEPNDAVWQTISQRLGFDKKPANETSRHVIKSGLSRLWPVLTGVATAASLLLAVLLWRESQIPVAPGPVQHVAVVKGEDASSYWLIEVHPRDITVRAGSSFQGLADKDYELWAVATNEPNPVSLGLLPKQGELVLAKNTRFDQLDIQMLAVSEEPLGGSPSGLPTRVLYTAELDRL